MQDLLSLRESGTYALILRAPRAAQVRAGRLGRVNLPAGGYAYIGSAFGPGGLGGRLRHHLGAIARPRWHIDTLRAVASLEQVWISAEPRRREHDWARTLERSPGVCVPVRGFGSSDCRCAAHLFHWERSRDTDGFARRLRKSFPEDAPLRVFELDLEASAPWLGSD